MAVTTAAKCTFFFQQGEHGWSESYYTLKTIADAYDVSLILGNALIRLRGNTTKITALRISLVPCPTNQGPAPRASQLFPPLATWSAGGAVIAANVTGGAQSDSFSASILARCVPSNPQPGTKSIFMGGMPDIYDQAGGQLLGSFTYMYGIPPIKSLQQALWQNAFGWLGITSAPAPTTTPIATFSQSTGGIVTLGFNANPIPGSSGIMGLNGVYVPFRVSGITTPGNLNGVWPFRVFQNGPKWYITMKKPVACLSWTGDGQVTFSPKNFIPFIQANVGTPNPTPTEIYGNVYAEKVAKRKRGLPFGLQHGRQKTLKTY